VASFQNELSRARALHRQDVPADSVGIGSRVTLLRLRDGQAVKMTFLGPWDSNVDMQVYSYQTPLAQVLMGKPLGHTVRLKLDGEEGDYRIEHLEPGL